MKKFKIILISIMAVIIGMISAHESASIYRHRKSSLVLHFQEHNNGMKYTFSRGQKVLQTVYLHPSFIRADIRKTANGRTLFGSRHQKLYFEILKDTADFSLYRITQNLTRGDVGEACLDLAIGRTNWYGGPENRLQYWPVEKSSYENYSYVSKEADNSAITERYWLNSEGVFIYVEDETPLFIDQNTPRLPNSLCLRARKDAPYDLSNKRFTFNYQIGISHTDKGSRHAHLEAVRHLLKKPTGIPDERMVRHPIWSTWALYKDDIDEQIVQSFADDILKNKFKNSQLEMNGDWEDCYGALTFRKSKFSNISALTSSLKAKGFRVTLWIHPFINKNCNPWYNDAKRKGYLVLDHKGNPDTQWWNSKENEAAYIDFTKPEAAKWFTDRVRKLQKEDGIDSFKFDTGEAGWLPKDPVLNGKRNLHPSLITSAYVRTVAKFGSMIEVRSGQGTQDLPVFVRMMDKDSEWNWNNGLVTLITTLLQLNIAGYPFILPDMIGGNGYNNHPPNKELFIRWLQANVFMPSLQFSYVPWQYDQETVNISLAMTKLHDQYTDLIIRRFKLAAQNGDPVNPPLWWADPNDVVAKQIYDQFMLGDEIIAAPVITEGKVERDIYLPAGIWQDGNDRTIHKGPKWIMNYPAPLEILPYFVRI